MAGVLREGGALSAKEHGALGFCQRMSRGGEGGDSHKCKGWSFRLASVSGAQMATVGDTPLPGRGARAEGENLRASCPHSSPGRYQACWLIYDFLDMPP